MRIPGDRLGRINRGIFKHARVFEEKEHPLWKMCEDAASKAKDRYEKQGAWTAWRKAIGASITLHEASDTAFYVHGDDGVKTRLGLFHVAPWVKAHGIHHHPCRKCASGAGMVADYDSTTCRLCE